VDVWWLKEREAHMKEWMNKTQKFIDCVFSLSNNHGVKCSCSRCRNVILSTVYSLYQTIMI
jgi:cytidine deaminase